MPQLRRWTISIKRILAISADQPTPACPNLLCLPTEILFQILLELYRHNKDWQTDLAFFQASKVHPKLRDIALEIVEQEKLDPIKQFLFTRSEWLTFLESYSVTQLNDKLEDRHKWQLHIIKNAPRPDLTTFQADCQTHKFLVRLILGRLEVDDFEHGLVGLIVKHDWEIIGLSLWKLERWQKMVGLLRKKARSLGRLDSLPFRLIRKLQSKSARLIPPSARLDCKLIQQYLFHDAEWDLIRTLSWPFNSKGKRWMPARFFGEILVRYIAVWDALPNRGGIGDGRPFAYDTIWW